MPQQVTHPYGVEDVERLLHLPRSTIRAFVTAGFVSPVRGARKALRFSFQDLIVLRTAQALANAQVSRRRITHALRELRKQLPESMPLEGLSIGAVGDQLVVKQGAKRWQARSGQYLLAFEGDALTRPLARGARAASPEELFDTAVSLETTDAGAAIAAYQRAIAQDPCLIDARINLGRLLHQLGRHGQAEKAYRDAVKACGEDAVVLYNLGVLLDDLGRTAEAVAAYEAALARDDAMADCHYNLALLYEKLRQPKAAIRHMSRYRALAHE